MSNQNFAFFPSLLVGGIIMSKSEFRWNKKRKHYAYIHKNYGVKYLNILITSKPIVLRKGKKTIINIPLHHHPNKKKEGQYYVIPRNYIDNNDSFDIKIYDWVWEKTIKEK